MFWRLRLWCFIVLCFSMFWSQFQDHIKNPFFCALWLSNAGPSGLWGAGSCKGLRICGWVGYLLTLTYCYQNNNPSPHLVHTSWPVILALFLVLQVAINFGSKPCCPGGLFRYSAGLPVAHQVELHVNILQPYAPYAWFEVHKRMFNETCKSRTFELSRPHRRIEAWSHVPSG